VFNLFKKKEEVFIEAMPIIITFTSSSPISVWGNQRVRYCTINIDIKEIGVEAITSVTLSSRFTKYIRLNRKKLIEDPAYFGENYRQIKDIFREFVSDFYKERLPIKELIPLYNEGDLIEKVEFQREEIIDFWVYNVLGLEHPAL
jgi:hypothetical protein